MFATSKLAICIAAALAVTSGVAAWETDDRTPYMDKDGNVKCCYKRSEVEHALGTKLDGLPYEDANGNLKCCYKPGQAAPHINTSGANDDDRTPYMDKDGNVKCCYKRSEVEHALGTKLDGLPYEDANGNLKCCYKPGQAAPHINTSGANDDDRTPYMDKDGNVKCCYKRSEVEHALGTKLDGLPYEDANGNLKCCYKQPLGGHKSSVFLPIQ